MVDFRFDMRFVWLLFISRASIGIAFVGIAIELVVIVRALSSALLFRRTVLMFAIFIGACGTARLVDAYLMFDMMGGPIHTHEVLIWVFDTASAITSLSAMVALIPLVWNATGGHCHVRGL